MKKKVIKLSSVQKSDLLTVAERLDILEEENLLKDADIEHLRQRLDQAQEANYLLECDVIDNHKRLVEIKYKQACERFRRPLLGDKYRAPEDYFNSFGGDIERMLKAKQNWGKLVEKILK